MNKPDNYDFRVTYTRPEGQRVEQWFYTLSAAKDFKKVLKALDCTDIKLKKVEA